MTVGSPRVPMLTAFPPIRPPEQQSAPGLGLPETVGQLVTAHTAERLGSPQHDLAWSSQPVTRGIFSLGPLH